MLQDAKIREWCASVWQAYSESHQKVRDLLSKFLIETERKWCRLGSSHWL